MGEVNEYLSDSITSTQCDESYRRVNAYVAALGLHHEFLRNELVRRILERTLEKRQLGQGSASLTLSINEIEQEMILWLSQVLALSPDETVEILLRGRLAMLLINFPGRWQKLFLTDPPWPDEFVRAMRESYLKAVPHFYSGFMIDRPLDLGYLPQLAEATLLTLEKTRWLRLILLWGGFIGFFTLLFFLSR